MAGAARKEGGGRRVAADEDVATAARRNLRAASAMRDMPGRDENAARDRPVDAPPRLQSRDHPDKEWNISYKSTRRYEILVVYKYLSYRSSKHMIEVHIAQR